MIVHFEDSPSPPACFNRDPGPASYTRYGIDQLSGERIQVDIPMDWATKGCGAWHGTGIGPNGERYPEAYGWKPHCLLCKHMPEEYK